jgi:hypothetical protein
MPTVHSQDGFRFVIYFDDHEPAHTHVFKSGETVIILGESGDKLLLPYIRENRGMSRQDERRALFIAIEHQIYLLSRWEEING